MTEMPSIYRKYSTQLWYILLSSAFFFFFIVIYRPFEMPRDLDMGRDWFILNATLMMCIVLVTLTITRHIYYLLRNSLGKNWWHFVGWTALEMVFLTYALALYLYLMGGRSVPYFEQLAICLQYSFMILLFPYFGITVICALVDGATAAGTPERDIIRFTDANRQVKIVLQKDAILYIRADENFVQIHYLDSGKVKRFSLRSTMQALGPLMEQYGLYRCHRSYYVNLSHIVAIRKDPGDMISAELNVEGETIPVSRRLYHTLLEKI